MRRVWSVQRMSTSVPRLWRGLIVNWSAEDAINASPYRLSVGSELVRQSGRPQRADGGSRRGRPASPCCRASSSRSHDAGSLLRQRRPTHARQSCMGRTTTVGNRWGSARQSRRELMADPTDGEVEGAGGEECVGRLGEDPPQEAPAVDGHRGAQLASSGCGAQRVLDVD